MATEVKLKLAIEGGRIVSQEIDGVTHSVGHLRGASVSTSASLADMGAQALALTKTFSGLIAIQKGVAAAADYAGLASRMKLLTGSAEQAAAAMQTVQDIALRQGASLSAVGDSYAKIGQVMLALGGTSADTARMVETVAGALRLGNASTQEAASAMRQFGQAMAKGKLSGDEFVSLMENAPYLMDAVAASLGKTKGDLFAMAEAGKLTAQVFGDAVLGSFDAVTGKAATLAPTVGQAMERLTTAFTVAAAESSNIGLATSAAFGAMGAAAEHAGLILGALTTGAMAALINQTLKITSAVAGHVTASMAERAAMATSLQTTVAQTEAKAIYTGMVLREAQATLANTTGLGASVVAQNAVIAASRAHTAATVAQTEAQMALNAATGLGARTLGLLGGPIGAVTAVLGLGLGAWSLWGSSAKDAEEKAAGAVERSTASIVADLDNQIQRLERRNALANAKLAGAGYDLASPAAERLGALQLQLDALEKQNGLSTEQRLTQKNKLLAEQGQLQQKLLELEQKSAPERAANATRAHAEAMAKYAPVVDKATAAIEAERKALGALFTAEDEAKIKAYFATRKAGVATLSAAEASAARAKTEAHRILLANAAEHTKMVDDAIDADEKALALVNDQIKTAATMLEQIEFETELLGLNTEQRALATLERELERQGIVKGTLAYDAYIAKLREAQAAKSGKQADIANQKAAEKAAADLQDANQKAAQASEKYWEDALMRAFESGKGFFESLWDTIKNTLKTQVLKVGVQAVMGSLGLGAAGAAGASDSLGSGILSNAAGSYLKDAALSSLFASNAAYGAAIGTTSIGAGSQAAMLAAQTGEFGLAGLTATSNAAAGAGAGASSAMAAAGPYIAAAMALYALHTMSQGETRSGGQYGYSATNADGAQLLHAPSGGDFAADKVKPAIDTTVAYTNDLLKKLGSTAAIATYQAAYQTSEKNRGGVLAGGTLTTGATFGESGAGSEYKGDRYDPSYGFELNAEEAVKYFAYDLQAATIEALKAATDLDAGLADKLSAYQTRATTLTKEAIEAKAAENAALLAQINTVISFTEVAKTLPFDNLKDLSFDAAAGLIAAAGGMDALGANLNTYYGAFYSAEEQRAQTITNITRALQAAGAELSAADVAGATREQFRAAVEGQDLSTEAGQKLYAALLSVAGAFDGLVDASEAAAEALAKTNQGWQDQLDVLTGATTEREIALRNVTDASTRAIMRQVYAQEDLKSATDSTIESYNNIMDAARSITERVNGISASVSDSIFQMQYGMEDNAGKYNMLDVRGKTLNDQLRSSTDIYVIADLAEKQVALLNQAWGLLDPEQQKAQILPFEDKLNEINDFVMKKGADPVALAKAQAAETAKTIAEAVKKAIEEAMADPTGALAQAAADVKAAASTPAQVTSNVNVTVTAPAGSEVSVA